MNDKFPTDDMPRIYQSAYGHPNDASELVEDIPRLQRMVSEVCEKLLKTCNSQYLNKEEQEELAKKISIEIKKELNKLREINKLQEIQIPKWRNLDDPWEISKE